MAWGRWSCRAGSAGNRLGADHGRNRSRGRLLRVRVGTLREHDCALAHALTHERAHALPAVTTMLSLVDVHGVIIGHYIGDLGA